MIAKAVYKKELVHRYDGEPYIRYFSAADFPGLGDGPFRFGSGENTLSAHRYAYGGERGELIVFFHGIGAGHRAYMREIELLCRRGYTVIAYDNTGCAESGGADIGGFSQGLADAYAALAFLKKTGELNKYERFFVMGHSWGGYAAANVPAFFEGIGKAVAISGFLSVQTMLCGLVEAATPAPLKKSFLKTFLSVEEAAAPRFFAANALQTVPESKTRFLFACSEDDPMVPFKDHTGALQKLAPANARFLITAGKKHNPNYTPDAGAYMNEVFGGFQTALKSGKLKTEEEKRAYFADTDWLRMTAQDAAFWDRVIAFLDE